MSRRSTLRENVPTIGKSLRKKTPVKKTPSKRVLGLRAQTPIYAEVDLTPQSTRKLKPKTSISDSQRFSGSAPKTPLRSARKKNPVSYADSFELSRENLSPKSDSGSQEVIKTRHRTPNRKADLSRVPTDDSPSPQKRTLVGKQIPKLLDPRKSSSPDSDSGSPIKRSRVKVVKKPATIQKKPPVNPKKTPAKRKNVDLDELSKLLHASAVPDRLACREEEFQVIYDFVLNNVEQRTSRSYYISGVPGTGKTATVLKVIAELEDEDELSFDFVSVNGMRLRDPNQCFQEIHSQLNLNTKGKHVAAVKAAQELNTRFRENNIRRRPVVLLIDELDYLCTKRQHVLYTIFDWATLPSAALTVLAIANTLDLPERLLAHRVASRMGMSRLCFQPYNFEQIQAILSARLRYDNVVDEDAVNLISRKVAAISGDLRRALEICRNSVQKALTMGKKRVTIAEVQAVVREMTQSGKIMAIQQASMHEKLLLQATVGEYKRTGNEEWTFGSLYPQYASLCAGDDVKALGLEALMGVVDRLSRLRIISTPPSRNTWTRQIRLNLPPEDITFAIFSVSIAS